MNRRKFLVTSATLAAAGLPLLAKTQSTQEFIWNEIVPITRRFDPQFAELMPRGFWYDTLPPDWKAYLDHKAAIGKYSCLAECWQDLRVPLDVAKAHTEAPRYSKIKWKYAEERWTWDYFKRMFFEPARANIEWDCMLLNLVHDGMQYSWYGRDSWMVKQFGYSPSAFERGEQIGILIHPESHYKGHANCKMWYEYRT